MGNTKIEWTSGPNGEPGYTFNPFLGCSKVHTGCANCYASVHQAVKMRKGGDVTWGEVWQGGRRVVVADSTWRHPLKWAREAAAAGQRRKVFCASLADVLEVPAAPPKSLQTKDPDAYADALKRVCVAQGDLDKARERLWDTIRKTAVVMAPDGTPREIVDPAKALTSWTGLDWLLLTKRPENWALVPEDVRPLVWLGTSVSDQETADQLVPRLLQAEGFRYRFLSVEPLVGPVDLGRWMGWWRCPDCGTARDPEPGQGLGSDVFCKHCDNDAPLPVDGQHLNWCIAGGESGPKARPCNVEWIRAIVRQCAEAGTACFVKQVGACYSDPENGVAGKDLHIPDEAAPLLARRLTDTKGGDWSEWPPDLRVRQWPGGSP